MSKRRDEDDGPRPTSRRWARRVLALVGLLIASAGAWTMWPSEGPRTPERPIYRTAVVIRRNLTQTVDATGRLEARGIHVVAAEAEGRLASLSVAPGDRVEAGTELARLSMASLQFALQDARARMNAARSRVAQAKLAARTSADQGERVARLARQGRASAAELEAAKSAASRSAAELEVAQAELASAQAGLERAQSQRARSVIRAPSKAVVLTAPERLGVPVSPQSAPLFTLAEDLATLTLRASVGEADIGRLRPGQRCTFEVPAFIDERFEASVERIGLVATDRGGLSQYPVWLTAKNPERRLRPGMTTNVRFETASVEGALVVPEGAVRFAPQNAPEAPARTRVFRVDEDGRALPITVRVGISDGRATEVVPKDPSSLRSGDRVAIGYLSPERRNKPGFSFGG